jgi:8-oxo-dGTP diphosphatase
MSHSSVTGTTRPGKREDKQKEKEGHKDPVPTVDLIVRKTKSDPHTILIETRAHPPFTGYYCLPGGHVDYAETVEDAAKRELGEETSIKAELTGILGVYSDPKRDPRGQRISTVFLADCVGSTKPKAGDDAFSAQWMGLREILNPQRRIAFDHRLIIRDYECSSAKRSIQETFWSTKRRQGKNRY